MVGERLIMLNRCVLHLQFYLAILLAAGQKCSKTILFVREKRNSL